MVRWKDVQIFAQDVGNPAPLPISIVRNLGDINSEGFEIEAGYAPSDTFNLYGTLYYGDAKYADGTIDLRWGRVPAVCDNRVCATNGDIGGNTTERQSKWQGTLGAEHRGELGGSYDLSYYVRGDLSYQSKQFGEAVNLSWVPARTLMNASIGVENDMYSAQLWARNLFDKKYVASVIVGQPNTQYNAYLGERRTFGLTVGIKY
jgi:iron complex outermembrane receptor protein